MSDLFGEAIKEFYESCRGRCSMAVLENFFKGSRIKAAWSGSEKIFDEIEISKSYLKELLFRELDLPLSPEKMAQRTSTWLLDHANTPYFFEYIPKIPKIFNYDANSEVRFLLELNKVLKKAYDLKSANHLSSTFKEKYYFFEETQKALDFERMMISSDLKKIKSLDDNLLINFFIMETEKGFASPRLDSIFDVVFQRIKRNPELKKNLMSETLIQKIYFDENKKSLALLQLDESLGLSRLKSAKKLPKKNEVRQIVSDFFNKIDKQFPGPSQPKNEIIDFVEKSLLTNKNETELLSSLKITSENWVKNKKLPLLDLHYTLLESAPEPVLKLELLEHLLGIREVDFTKILKKRSKASSFYNDIFLESKLNEAKVLFKESNIHVRTYVLMSLLDSKEGILSNRVLKEKVFQNVLGNNYDNMVIRESFEAYLNSVPESEQKVIISHILSSFVDQKAGNGASLKTVLESMGPFGVKVGQFLRTSGLVPLEHRKELDVFLDHALEPDRKEIFKKLQSVLGKNLRFLSSTEELLGSGSINFVVKAEVLNPRSKQKEKIVFRFQRENVEGLIQNENATWTSAVEILKKSKNPESRRLAETIDEVRSQVYETTKPGGVQLDQENERNLFKKAIEAYASPVSEETGFSIDVARPHDEIQKLVPESLQKQVSVYHYVDAVSVDKVEPKELREMLSKQIVRAEFNAVFKKGIFDSDAHSGNWLVDLKNKKLIRIDYPELVELSALERESLNRAVGVLIEPKLNKNTVKILRKEMKTLFQITSNNELLETELLKIVSHKSFPKFSEPHERLFFIRDAIETLVSKGEIRGRIRIQDGTRNVFASMAKTKIYTEHISNQDYLKNLLDSLGQSDRFNEYYRFAVKNEVREKIKEAVLSFPQNLNGIKNCFRSWLGKKILRK